MTRTPCERNTAGTALLWCPSPSWFCTCPSAQAELLTVGKALGCNWKDPQLPSSFPSCFLCIMVPFYSSPIYSYAFNAVLFLFPLCQCSLLPLPFSSDTWIDFMVHRNEKTFSAVQRVRVKTTERAIVQPTGPWLESDIARVVSSRFQGDLHGFQYHLHCWWLCDHKSH